MSAIRRLFCIEMIVSVQDEVSANQRFLKFGIKRRSIRVNYHDLRPVEHPGLEKQMVG